MKITISAQGLTVEDYLRSGCNEAVAACPRKSNIDYVATLHTRMDEAQAAGEESSLAVVGILHAIMASGLPWNPQPPEVLDHPLFPVYELDESARAYVRQILDRIDDHEVRARSADKLYQQRLVGAERDYTAADTAARGYLKEALRQEVPGGSWCEAKLRVERALTIANELNYKNLRQAVLDHIERAIETHSTPRMALAKGDGSLDEDELPSLYPSLQDRF